MKWYLIPAVSGTFILGLIAMIALYFILDARIREEAIALRNADTQLTRDINDVKVESAKHQASASLKESSATVPTEPGKTK